MHASLLNPSKYIKAIHFLGKDRTVTITGIRLQEIEREDGSKEKKGVISLAETDKGWIVNVTNVKCLVAMFGTETDKWIGKKVTLFPEPNESSESGVAIRVRGSPELAKDVTFTLKLARKKPRKVTLKATGKNGNAKQAAAAPAEPPPTFEDANDADQGGETPAMTNEEHEAFERGFASGE